MHGVARSGTHTDRLGRRAQGAGWWAQLGGLRPATAGSCGSQRHYKRGCQLGDEPHSTIYLHVFLPIMEGATRNVQPLGDKTQCIRGLRHRPKEMNTRDIALRRRCSPTPPTCPKTAITRRMAAYHPHHAPNHPRPSDGHSSRQ